MGFSGVAAGLKLQAGTPIGGFTLVNGTPGILSWTAPSDGQNHRFLIFSALVVTNAETGGQISYLYTPPGIVQQSHSMYAANAAPGQPFPVNLFSFVIAPGTTVTVVQATALTVGNAILWAEIWGA